jgi:NAD(P)-dependent dehydrogenase (short-subunit alcohol dehydrogenase family)
LRIVDSDSAVTTHRQRIPLPHPESTPMHPTPSALVTGASSGIGKACALALLREGWQVTLLSRRADALAAVIHEAGRDGERALIQTCDVSDPTEVATAFAAHAQRFGRLDLLFNNAGVFLPPRTPDEISTDDWHRAVDINLNGMFHCLSAAFRQMRAQSPQGGRIINNGSISASAPRPGSMPYTVTKHAITGMTKAASLDGRAFDIAVGQIDIGNVATDITERMASGVQQADGSIRAEPRMAMEGVVDTFMAMVRLPLSANVLFTTVMATKMPYVGRG